MTRSSWFLFFATVGIVFAGSIGIVQVAIAEAPVEEVDVFVRGVSFRECHEDHFFELHDPHAGWCCEMPVLSWNYGYFQQPQDCVFTCTVR